MKGAHYRPWNWSRPNLIMFVVALCVSVVGLVLGLEALHDKRAESIIPPTSSVAPDLALHGEESLGVANVSAQEPRTSATAYRPRAEIGTAVSIVPTTTTSTSTSTTVPLSVTERVLQVARGEVGKTGPYAEGGFWCASFASFVAAKAEVPQFEGSDSPARLYATAVEDGRITDTPEPGYLVFIDLTGENFANEYVSHVGIVEFVDGETFTIIQGNGEPDPSVVTRTTYRVGDGYVVAFAPFGKA
jgi:hypothetical protein